MVQSTYILFRMFLHLCDSAFRILIRIDIFPTKNNYYQILFCLKQELIKLTTSISGIFIDLPVLNEVSMPFFVIGAEGSVPFSVCGNAGATKMIV